MPDNSTIAEQQRVADNQLAIDRVCTEQLCAALLQACRHYLAWFDREPTRECHIAIVQEMRAAVEKAIYGKKENW